MKELRKALGAYLSSPARDQISGFGMAFDPVPCRYRRTFYKSDLMAFMADHEALLLDWYRVATKAAYEIELHQSEVGHHWKRRDTSAGATKRQAGGREREAV
jgi:hypothetical protein